MALQVLLAGIGLGLIVHALRAATSRALTLATAALLVLGTFALDLLVRPGLAGPAALLALSALALRARAREVGPGRTLTVGVAAGGAAALHWPAGALVLLAWPRRGERWRGAAAALGAAAAVVAAAHLARVAAPVRTGPWEPMLTLWGSRQGLLYLTPALWLGVFGLVRHLRRAGADAVPPAAALALLVALHAACRSGSDGPCPREQMAPALALLAVPMAEALAAIAAFVRRAPGAPLWAAGLLLVCRNLLFMQQYADGMIPRDFPVPFPEVARGGAALLAQAAGSPLAWPANLAFARRHGTSADRFDAAAGKPLPREASGASVIDVGRWDQDRALLLEGWSVRHPCGGAVCRAVESRARLLLPLERGGAALELAVRAAGTGSLTAALDGQPPAAALPLAPVPRDLLFRFGPATAGMHTITLSGPPGAAALVDEIRARVQGRP